VFCHDGDTACQSIDENMERLLEKEENYIPFSLLILDYNLPYLSGLEIIQKTREKYAKNGVPLPKILLLTAIED
jgi:DNA-binding response OmpR family regulator